MESYGGEDQIMSRTKRRESGLDKFLRGSMAEDKQFRALFLAEAAKLPAATQRGVLRHSPIAGSHRSPSK